jgi:hypothetical protein
MQADLSTLIAAIKHDGEPRIWNRVFDNSSVVDIATRYYWAALKDFPPAGTGGTWTRLFTLKKPGAASRLSETPPKLPADLRVFVAKLQDRQNGGISSAAMPKLTQYRDFASDILGSAIETVYGTDDDAYGRRLIVLYNGSLLERIFRPENHTELANCFHLASLSVYEIVNHFTRYVVSRQPGGDDVKAFSEHLVHPSFDFFLGLALLSQFRPLESDPDTKLSTIVAKILKQRLTEERLTTIRTNLNLLDDDEAQQLLEDELGEHNGEQFVYDAWVVSALLHDIGYYFASLWDLHNLITRFDAKGNPTVHALELAAGLPIMYLRSKQLRNQLTPLLGMSDFITPDHLAELGKTLQVLAQGPIRSEYTSYLKDGKQLHPFWSAFEIFKRLQNHGEYFTQRQKLLMYVAIDTIYPHQFPSQHEANLFRGNLPKIEADLGDEFLVFRKNPLAFCLYLVDNCQNFSRYQFVAMENVPQPKQALNIPMKDRKLEVLFDKDYKPPNSDILRFRVLIGGEDHRQLHVLNSGLLQRIERSNQAEEDYSKAHGDDPYLFYVELAMQGDKQTIPK